MKHTFNNFIKLGLVFGFVYACSPTKNTFVSRNMNALGTKFNVLFNGNEALAKGLEQLDKNYKDNFYKRIAIEPLKADKKLLRPTLKNNSNFKYFDRAEEKAVKAIQTHDMTIRGVEYNKQIDQAYLLLGKARYYTQRFVPAMDAFNHTIKNDSKSNLIYETRLWQAKTEIRLQNEMVAVDKLQSLIKFNPVPKNVEEAGYTAIAMAYNQIDSTSQVIKNLQSATKIGLNPIQNSRNLIVLGQIYREQAQIDSSNLYFNQLLNFKKAPYKFKVQAQIEIAKNYKAKQDSVYLVLMETLHKMVKNYDNVNYLDAIYYVMGDIEHKNHDFKAAKDYFNLSLKAKKIDVIQKIHDYEQLGNISFEEKKYVTAGKYYDKIINAVEDKNTRKIRQITRKRDKLKDVIMYDALAERNDSILKIVSLDSASQVAVFKKHIAQLKKQEKDSITKVLADIRQRELEQSQVLNSSGSSKSSFYFYNKQLVGFGRQEFSKIWGSRKLTDNWRYSDNTSLSFNKKTESKKASKSKIKEKFTVAFYTSQIPTSDKAIDSITKQRNDSYFELGLIYKEQFRDYPLAIHYLDSLLHFNLAKNRILPTHYHLYKMYQQIDSTKAELEKDFITQNYPESRYAQLILNPNKTLVFNDTNSPEAYYKMVYNNYIDGKYVAVDSLSAKALKTYNGLPIIPKFKLLRAYAIAKLDGYKQFNKLAKDLAQEYPNTIEGKKAKKMMLTIKDELAKANDFKTKPTNKVWYLAYQINKNKDVSELENKLRNIIYEEEFSNLSLDQKLYDRTTKFLLIKGFSSVYSCKDFTTFIQKKYKKVMPTDFFVISQSVYNKIQLHKNLKNYLKTKN